MDGRWSTAHRDDGYDERMRMERQLEEQREEQRHHAMQADHALQEMRAAGEGWIREAAESAISECIETCMAVLAEQPEDSPNRAGIQSCIDALEELE